MEFRVLGPLEVLDDRGDEVVIGSPSQRTILAVLLAAGGRGVTADRLADALWGDEVPRTAQQSLRTYISRLRGAVGDRLQRRATAYVLDVGEDTLDAERFEHLLATAESLTGSESAVALRQALDLWRGDAFADIDERAGLAGRIRGLAERRSGCRERLAGVLLETGQTEAAVAAAEELVADEPLREATWAVLVRSLAASDRVAEALRAYQRACDTLAESGLEPSVVLRDAEADALAGIKPPVEAPGDRATIRSFASSMRGRRVDVDGVIELLERCRVVTLIGPGGVGKTRLAFEVARHRVTAHRSGVRVAELAGVEKGADVAAAVSDALGISTRAGSFTEVLDRASDLDLLLVLDNCEHVIDSVADVVERLAGGTGQLQILATSRERIGVDGEQSWPVSPLPAGTGSGPAVELFVDRARSHLPAFEVGPGDRECIARIVERLDGLPLAIEMAAARLPSLGLARLERELVDRFDILRNARRRGDARHRTLDAVIQWSEDLLTDDERAVLAELSVFAGPVSGEDVALVVGRPDAVVTVGGLVERSLVIADHRADPVSYRLFEMVRRHGQAELERTPRWDELRRRHARHYVRVAAEADRDLRTADEPDASRRLDRCFAELRIAHAWGREHDPSLAAVLSERLHLYAGSRQRHEVFSWAADLVDGSGVVEGTGPLLASMAWHANDTGRLADARELGRRSLAASAGLERRYALECLADTAMYEGNLDECERLARSMLDLGNEADDSLLRVMGTSALCLAQAYSGRQDDAIASLQQGPADLPSPSAAAWLAYTEGEVVLDRDPARALDALQRAIRLAEDAGNRFVAGVATVSEVTLLGRTGEPAEALRRYAAVIDHWHRRSDQTHQLTTLRNLVSLLDRIDDHANAAELLGAVLRVEGVPTFGEEADRMARAADRARSALGADFDQLLERGARRDVRAAARWALRVIAGHTAHDHDG